MLRQSLVILSLMGVTACSGRRIPGTEISDNSDTRSILQVMERYRAALEAQDAKAVQALLSKNFHDDAGTDSPDDDLTFANVPEKLPARLAQLSDIKLELNVRRISVADNVANAIYYWNASFRIPKLHNKPQKESELEQMLFEQVDGDWKIISGI